MKYPVISYCIATYNEEHNIASCLESIFSQDYPKEKLDVIVVDDESTDKTRDIAKQFPVRIYTNGTHNADRSFFIGFQRARGEFFTAVGADMEFVAHDWFKKMIRPFSDNPDIPAAFTRYFSHPKESLITKYLSLNPIQLDLVYQFFTPSFEDVITKKRHGYYLCYYEKNKIPPQVHGLYRVDVLRRLLKAQSVWYDMGNLVRLVEAGYHTFAYVPDAGYYHFHAEGLFDLLRKRKRNITQSYLKYIQPMQYTWFDITKPKDIAKIALLIIGANTVVPILLISLYRSARYRNLLYLLDIPVTIILVDFIIWQFIKNPRGRALIANAVKTLLFPYETKTNSRV